MNHMFVEQIGKTIKVYVADMLVKSLCVSNHFTHLLEMFSILRAYHMKLNPNKCAFRASSRDFLSFIVNQRDIKANPIRF